MSSAIVESFNLSANSTLPGCQAWKFLIFFIFSENKKILLFTVQD
ncbi:hypothetical protein K661_01246 [Piscirickettsia salmonis LF-89 = ATCC VR-1361]|nr:hypothetical protein K661_01246 [Piscirickettsia salmonis LF-89 = ATCC VR-1361]